MITCCRSAWVNHFSCNCQYFNWWFASKFRPKFPQSTCIFNSTESAVMINVCQYMNDALARTTTLWYYYDFWYSAENITKPSSRQFSSFCNFSKFGSGLLVHLCSILDCHDRTVRVGWSLIPYSFFMETFANFMTVPWLKVWCGRDRLTSLGSTLS